MLAQANLRLVTPQRSLFREALALITATLLLTSCGTAEDEEPQVVAPPPTMEETTPEPVSYELGQDFHLETAEGADITVTIPATAPQVDAMRTELGIDPVSYASATVDNREGTVRVNMYQVALYDEEGKEYLFDSASGPIGDWSPNWDWPEGGEPTYSLQDGTVITEAQYEDLNSRAGDLYNANLSDVEPLAQGEILLIGPADLPESVTGVAVQPSGMGEPYYATPSDQQ